MNRTFKTFFVDNWIPSFCGVMLALCTTANLMELLPEPWKTRAMALCGFLTAMGLIGSKQANKSNSSDPAGAVTVTGTISSKPNPAAVVVPVLALVLLAGCSAAQVQSTDVHAVLLKLHADGKTVLVDGCAGMPARHVLLNTILPFVPPQYGIPAQGALAIEAVAATALCTQVQQMPTVASSSAKVIPAP